MEMAVIWCAKVILTEEFHVWNFMASCPSLISLVEDTCFNWWSKVKHLEHGLFFLNKTFYKNWMKLTKSFFSIKNIKFWYVHFPMSFPVITLSINCVHYNTYLQMTQNWGPRRGSKFICIEKFNRTIAWNYINISKRNHILRW